MADSAREQLKEQLKKDAGFKAELRDRIKSALLSKVPAAQEVKYNFDRCVKGYLCEQLPEHLPLTVCCKKSHAAIVTIAAETLTESFLPCWSFPLAALNNTATCSRYAARFTNWYFGHCVQPEFILSCAVSWVVCRTSNLDSSAFLRWMSDWCYLQIR